MASDKIRKELYNIQSVVILVYSIQNNSGNISIPLTSYFSNSPNEFLCLFHLIVLVLSLVLGHRSTPKVRELKILHDGAKVLGPSQPSVPSFVNVVSGVLS